MVKESLMKEKVADLVHVSPENVQILGTTSSGKIRMQTNVYDKYIVTVYSNEDGSSLELGLNDDSEFEEYDDSQQSVIKAAAVWPCWFPSFAHCPD